MGNCCKSCDGYDKIFTRLSRKKMEPRNESICMKEIVVYGFVREAQFMFKQDNPYFNIIEGITKLIINYYLLDNATILKLTPKPEPSFDFEKAGDSLFEDLAKFMRILPPKSRSHIWEHAVKIKTSDGQKMVCDNTRDKGHVVKLLCDCVIVYVRYLERDTAPLPTKKAKPHVQSIAEFIHGRYHPLSRNQFQNDRTYFSAMLEDYIRQST